MNQLLGAKSRNEVVDCEWFLCRICAYEGLASNKSASSITGSYFDSCRCSLRKTGPGSENHVGKDVPVVVRHLKLNILSCGLHLLDVEIRL